MKRKYLVLFGVIVFLVSMSSMVYVFITQNSDPKKLDTPFLIAIATGYELSWYDVEHADLYKVYINHELVSEQSENTFIIDLANPFEGCWIMIEAIDLDDIYEKSSFISFFSPSSQTTPKVIKQEPDNSLFNTYQETTYTNKYGLALFRFEPILTTDYVVNIKVDNDTYTETLDVRLGNKNVMIDYDDSLNGYILNAIQYNNVIFRLYTFEPGQKIDIEISFLNIIDLSEEQEITIGAHETLTFPVIEPDDTYLIEVEKDSMDIEVMLYNAIYINSTFELMNDILFKTNESTASHAMRIENKSNEPKTIKLKPKTYIDMSNNESIDIEFQTSNTYLLLRGFEAFGFIFNLDFHERKSSFDVDVYHVNYLKGLFESHISFEHIDEDNKRMRITLSPYEDVAILIVIKNQNIIDDSMEPSSFIGYIA